MAGFSSFDDLINEYSVNDKIRDWPFYKVALPSTVVGGHLFHMWKGNGIPGAGADPATTPGTVYDNTDGAIWLQDEASDYKFLISAEMGTRQSGAGILFDVLAGVSGIALNSTGDKTINTGSLIRYTDGLYNQVWLEITTAGSGTPFQATVSSYTDEDGNSGQTGPTFVNAVGNTYQTELLPLPLNIADKGVRSVETLNVSVATTSAVCNVLIVHPIAILPCFIGQGAQIDFVRGLPPPRRIYDGASLSIGFMTNTTTSLPMLGDLFFAWG